MLFGVGTDSAVTDVFATAFMFETICDRFAFAPPVPVKLQSVH